MAYSLQYYIHFLTMTLTYTTYIHTYIIGENVFISFLNPKSCYLSVLGGVDQGGMVRSSMVSLSLTWVW